AHGSALRDDGIAGFLEQLDLLTETNYDPTLPFSARVYKIRHDENGNRITFIKVLDGSLRIRDDLTYGDGKNTITEKVTQLRIYHGDRFEQIEKIQAGEIAAVIGLSEAAIGDGLGTLTEKHPFEMRPI